MLAPQSIETSCCQRNGRREAPFLLAKSKVTLTSVLLNPVLLQTLDLQNVIQAAAGWILAR